MGVGADDPGQGGDPLGDQRRQPVEVGDADHGDEVGAAGRGVDLGDAIDPSSSRGPSACGQPSYPSLAAPGVDVQVFITPGDKKVGEALTTHALFAGQAEPLTVTPSNSKATPATRPVEAMFGRELFEGKE